MSPNGGEPPSPEPDLRAFIHAFRVIADHAAQQPYDSGGSAGPSVVDAAAEHLGFDPAESTSVGKPLTEVDRPNFQRAIDELLAASPRSVLLGLNPDVADLWSFTLASLLAGRLPGPSEVAAPTFDDLPVDVGRTLGCVRAGVWLTWSGDDPVVIGLAPSRSPFGGIAYRLEVFAARIEPARRMLERLTARMHELNVYRGKVLSFSFSEDGEFGLWFMPRPTTGVDDLVLREGDLESILAQTVGMSRWTDELRAAGQHLKRGLLLHGPPGTGKTHTVGMLLASMPERTVVILQGPGVGALGQAAAIVRALTPSMLVIEDVDLIAASRDMLGEETGPLLFQLLNEMDGLAPGDDVIFVLTTNRLEVLEPALTARPGRIDHAVHIDLPDTEARRRLLELYLAPVTHRITDPTAVVAHTEGVTASFIKELVRRAVIHSLEAGDRGVVRDEHLAAATTDLLTVRGSLAEHTALESEWDDDWGPEDEDG